MRLLERLSGLMTADLDLLLEQVENPELTITQLICDMEESIVDLRRETVTAVARQSRIRKRLFAANEASRGVELQATLAVQRGDEVRARQILGRKIGVLKSRDALEVELAEASGLAARLVAGLIRMEDQAQLARRKKDAVVRRRRTLGAERRSRATEARDGIHTRRPETGPGGGAFDGYAQAIRALEAGADAGRKLPSDGVRAVGRAERRRHVTGEGELEGGGRC
jgi:phage shock protein A